MYKLIRDNIPELLEKENKACHYATANTDGLFAELLRAALMSDTNTFLQTSTVESLADILEDIKAIVEVGGINADEFKKLCDDKLATEGGYTKRLIGFFADPQPTQTTEAETK